MSDDSWYVAKTQDDGVIARLQARITDLERELSEEHRLNAMGSEREARLMARVTEIERERDKARAQNLQLAEAVGELVTASAAFLAKHPDDCAHTAELWDALKTVNALIGKEKV